MEVKSFSPIRMSGFLRGTYFDNIHHSSCLPQRGQVSLLIFDSDCLSVSPLVFNFHTLSVVGGDHLWFWKCWLASECIKTECRNTEKEALPLQASKPHLGPWATHGHPEVEAQCFESNNRYTSYTFARFKDGSQDYQHFDIWMMGWWTGAPLAAGGSDQSQKREMPRAHPGKPKPE